MRIDAYRVLYEVDDAATTNLVLAFFREIVEHGEVWTIRDAGGVPAPAHSDGQRAMPFWSL